MPGRQDRTTSHIQDMARRSNAAGMDTAAAEYRKLFLRRPILSMLAEKQVAFDTARIETSGFRRGRFDGRIVGTKGQQILLNLLDALSIDTGRGRFARLTAGAAAAVVATDLVLAFGPATQVIDADILREALPALDAGATGRIRGRTTLPLELTFRQTTTVRRTVDNVLVEKAADSVEKTADGASPNARTARV